VEQRRRTAREKDLARHRLPGFNGLNAVYDRRSLLGVPDGWRRG
jgi:hypothetical protein